MSSPHDGRLDQILEVLLSYARADFSQKAPVSDQLDAIDAIATGLNMMGDELHGAVASRRELEDAYRALQEAQAKLVHSGKLIAVGQLASGVAHEINNPANWVMMSLTLASRQLTLMKELSTDARDLTSLRHTLSHAVRMFEASLADAMEGMERIRTIAGDLRTFSRADGDEVELVSLSEVASSAANLAGAFLRQRAQLSMELSDGPWVLGNRGRLAQVVTNLLVNAAQAVGENNAAHSRVHVTTRVEGKDAVLTVEDSGPGVPEALRARIFDPFFTTKPAGQGTGLGLSLVAELVHRHGGTVEVGTGVLRGASFEIRLPRAERPVPREAPSSQLAPRAPRLRVLVVDDEPNLLRTTAMVLQPDHDVCIAHGGAAAIARLEVDRAFDVVLCDLQMPEIDGICVYEQLERFAPELTAKMIFSTGGAFQSRVKDFLTRTSVPVLEKPVSTQVLLDAILQRGLGALPGSR